MFKCLKVSLALASGLLILSSCNSGGSSNSNPAGNTPNGDIVSGKARDMSLDLPNLFNSQQDVQNLPKLVYAQGCKVPGENRPSYGFDERLQPGHRIVRRFLTSGTEDFDVQTEDILRKTSKIKLVYEQNMLKFQSSLLNGITAQPYLSTPNKVIEESLELPDDKNLNSRPKHNEANLEDHINPEFMKQWLALPGTKNVRYSCHIESPKSLTPSPSEADKTPSSVETSNSLKFSMGTFRVENLNVQAWQYVSTYRGDVVCEKEGMASNSNGATSTPREPIRLGAGVQTVTEVRSNQVASEAYEFCGGNSLYTSILIKLNDGRVVQSFVNRLDSAPFFR